MNSLEFLKIIVLMDEIAGETCDLVGHHGASFFIETRNKGTIKNFLVDVGQSPEMIFHNMDRLSLSPKMLDAIVLTHCHYDHTGALVEVIRASGKKDLPVIAHPTVFRPHIVHRPSIRHIGVPAGNGPIEVEAAGGKLILSSEPVMLTKGVTTIGEVPRTTVFEEPETNRYTVLDGHFEVDSLKDDMALAVNIEGHGLVVITGCSHSGVVNITRRSLELFPGVSLQGVIGGFHLKNSGPERIEKTAEALEKLNPRWIAAGHCTGFNAQVAFRNRFGKDFQPLFTGKTVMVPHE